MKDSPRTNTEEMLYLDDSSDEEGEIKVNNFKYEKYDNQNFSKLIHKVGIKLLYSKPVQEKYTIKKQKFFGYKIEDFLRVRNDIFNEVVDLTKHAIKNGLLWIGGNNIGLKHEENNTYAEEFFDKKYFEHVEKKIKNFIIEDDILFAKFIKSIFKPLKYDPKEFIKQHLESIVEQQLEIFQNLNLESKEDKVNHQDMQFKAKKHYENKISQMSLPLTPGHKVSKKGLYESLQELGLSQKELENELPKNPSDFIPTRYKSKIKEFTDSKVGKLTLLELKKDGFGETNIIDEIQANKEENLFEELLAEGLLSTKFKNLFCSAERKNLSPTFDFSSDSDFENESFVDFLTTLRVINRSAKRLLNDREDSAEAGYSYNTDESYIRVYKFPETKDEIPSIINITPKVKRKDIVLNEGNYQKVYDKIQQIKDIANLNDQQVAVMIHDVITGKGLDFKMYTSILSEKINKDIVHISYLLFGTEVMRNPAALVHNYMAFKLLLSGPKEYYNWKNLLKCEGYKTVEGKFDGGVLPMSMKKAVESSRVLYKDYQKNTFYNYKYDDGEGSKAKIDNFLHRENYLLEEWRKLEQFREIGGIEKFEEVLLSECCEFYKINNELLGNDSKIESLTEN